MLVYYRFFNETERAEQLIHGFLEHQGYRISPNREFFNAPPHEVIGAINGIDDIGPEQAPNPAEDNEINENEEKNNKDHEPEQAFVYIVDIKHPVTKESFDPPVLIYLYPPESEIYQNALDKLTQQKDLIKKQCLNSDNMNDKLRNILREFLSECTFGWKNIEWDGKIIIFNYDNGIMLFKELHWLQDQVVHYYGSPRNINIILNRDQVVNDYRFIYEQCSDAQTHISMKIEQDYGDRPANHGQELMELADDYYYGIDDTLQD